MKADHTMRGSVERAAMSDAGRYPDMPLDDERENHVDNGQVQVEPGQAWAEACELACGEPDPGDAKQEA